MSEDDVESRFQTRFIEARERSSRTPRFHLSDRYNSDEIEQKNGKITRVTDGGFDVFSKQLKVLLQLYLNINQLATTAIPGNWSV